MSMSVALISASISGIPANGNKGNGAALSASGSSVDSNQVSPLTQVMTRLEQLQENNPVEYELVMRRTLAYLQSAAEVARAQGNPLLALRLQQLTAASY
jgi:hypothetical protein